MYQASIQAEPGISRTAHLYVVMPEMHFPYATSQTRQQAKSVQAWRFQLPQAQLSRTK